MDRISELAKQCGRPDWLVQLLEALESRRMLPGYARGMTVQGILSEYSAEEVARIALANIYNKWGMEDESPLPMDAYIRKGDGEYLSCCEDGVFSLRRLLAKYDR